MTNFNIENLEGKGITAEVLDGGAQYSSYEEFARSAGHPDAVMQNNDSLVSAGNIEGQVVQVLAKGLHGSRGHQPVIYVCMTNHGQKFLIGERGVKVMEMKLSDFTTDQLYKEIERRAFEAGFKAGKTVGEQANGIVGCDLGGVPSVSAPVQITRDDIVGQARDLIEELIDHGITYNEEYGNVGNGICQTKFYKVDFHVNEKKRAVTAVVETTSSDGSKPSYGVQRVVGVAKCDPNDCFNEFIGKAIALHRALGIEVPEELLNAPQPLSKQTGDIAEFEGKVYELVPKDVPVWGVEGKAHVGSLAGKRSRVINDTARYN
jgi:hypothetical protein